MVECLFCNIAQKKIKSEIIFENPEVMAFLDINPRGPAHTVVILKYHAESIQDLKSDQIDQLFEVVQSITKRLASVFLPDGFTIGINQGRAAGQMVDHLHVHIIPRYKDDGGSSLHNVVNNPSKESLLAIKDKILKNGHSS